MDAFHRVSEKRLAAKALGEPILRDETLKLILKIAEEKKPSRILEIGVNVGLTGVALLLVSENARLTGIEIDEDLAREAAKNYKEFGVSGRARVIIGDASEIIPKLTGKYDLIFLDGPKGHYYEYLPFLKDALRRGGILFADDVAFHGYIEGVAPRKHSTIKRSIENYLSAVKNDADFVTAVYDIEDGVCVSEKIVDEQG